jgi:hypothetical protein
MDSIGHQRTITPPLRADVTFMEHTGQNVSPLKARVGPLCYNGPMCLCCYPHRNRTIGDFSSSVLGVLSDEVQRPVTRVPSCHTTLQRQS